jgi:hypothetical protein
LRAVHGVLHVAVAVPGSWTGLVRVEFQLIHQERQVFRWLDLAGDDDFTTVGGRKVNIEHLNV